MQMCTLTEVTAADRHSHNGHTQTHKDSKFYALTDQHMPQPQPRHGHMHTQNTTALNTKGLKLQSRDIHPFKP